MDRCTGRNEMILKTVFNTMQSIKHDLGQKECNVSSLGIKEAIDLIIMNL